jgi:DnaJ-class molecular chaperone
MAHRITCPKCGGKGYYRDAVVTNPLVVVFTLGMSLACTDDCETCDGEGWIWDDEE